LDVYHWIHHFCVSRQQPLEGLGRPWNALVLGPTDKKPKECTMKDGKTTSVMMMMMMMMMRVEMVCH